MAIALVATLAQGQGSTFRIAQVFSDISGDTQFIELVESAGLDGQQRLAGLTLTTTHNGIVKRFTFDHDLPTDRTANRAIIVAVSQSLFLGGVATVTYDTIPPTVTQDAYAADVSGLPARFLPTDGGTLDFAGVDQITYASLPSNGIDALYRGGSVAQATVPANDHCQVRRLPCDQLKNFIRDDANAIEYYNVALDHYFVAASAPDLDALDSGPIPSTMQYRFIGYGINVRIPITATRSANASAMRWFNMAMPTRVW